MQDGVLSSLQDPNLREVGHTQRALPSAVHIFPEQSGSQTKVLPGQQRGVVAPLVQSGVQEV